MIDWIHEEIACCRCGTVILVHALGFAALPEVDAFVCPDCTTYKGDLDWKDEK